MRRGRSRIAHLRHDEYPEKFPDATVSDDVLGRLERAALLRLEALGPRRKRAPFVKHCDVVVPGAPPLSILVCFA